MGQRLSVVGLALATLAGCGGQLTIVGDDAAVDVTPTDTTSEAMADTPADVGMDAQPDVVLDASPRSMDAGEDVRDVPEDRPPVGQCTRQITVSKGTRLLCWDACRDLDGGCIGGIQQCSRGREFSVGCTGPVGCSGDGPLRSFLCVCAVPVSCD